MDELAPWALDEVKRLESRFEQRAAQGQQKIHHATWGRRRKSKLIWAGTFAITITAILSTIFVTTEWPWLHTKIDYQTQPGEQRKIVLPDGSLLHLNTATSVTIDYSADSRKIELLMGEALFDVMRVPNRSFVVSVIGHDVVTVGTTFNLQLTNGGVEIVVIEGQVAVRQQDALASEDDEFGAESDQGVLLAAGQGFEINAAGLVSEAAAVDVEAITAWDRGLLVFDGWPLRQAAEELSRYMLTDLRVVAGVPNDPVTGQVQIRDQQTMLSQFAQMSQVTPVRQSAELTLLYSASQ